MKKRTIRRGGRPRNTNAARYPNGEVRHAPKSALGSLAAASPEAIAQRAAFVGADKAHDARAGTAYGRLYLAGMLGSGRHKDRDVAAHGSQEDADRRYSAAEQADRICRTWASMAASRRADPNGPARHGDLDPAAWERADATYRAIRAAAERQGSLALSCLEALCVDGQEPPRMLAMAGYIRPGSRDYNALVERIHMACLDALDAVGEVLRVGAQQRRQAA